MIWLVKVRPLPDDATSDLHPGRADAGYAAFLSANWPESIGRLPQDLTIRYGLYREKCRWLQSSKSNRMLYLYHESGNLSPILWLSAGAFCALMLLCALLHRAPTHFLRSLTLAAVVFLSAGLGTSLTWVFAYQATLRYENRDHGLGRRLQELSEQASAPGSPFACLDPSIGESIQTACEKEVFASPAVVASEINYVRSQFHVLSDLKAQPVQSEAITNVTSSLRRSLEADRFGLFAYVLMTQDGCTAQQCKPLTLLSYPNHIKLNLLADTFDQYVASHRKAWSQAVEVSSAQLPTEQQRKKEGGLNFPSAASIPPVHIMTPDPAPTKFGPSSSVKSKTQRGSAGANAQATLASPNEVGYPVWMPAPSPGSANSSVR